MRRLVVGLIAALGAMAIVAPAAADARVKVNSDCLHARAKPHKIIVACADVNFYYNHLRWRSWTRKRAHGRGYAHGNDCKPNCADGEFHRRRARITLSRPRRCPDGSLLFSRISYKMRHHLPGFPRRRGHGRLFCPMG